MLRILYKDEHLVAIDKPAALLVHKTKMSNDKIFVLQLLREQLGQFVYPVHRLDRPTSGVLLFALNSKSASEINIQFKNRNISKTYLAVVRGFTSEKNVINHPLSEKNGSAKKKAITWYTRLATLEIPTDITNHGTSRYSLIAAMPETGRMHQIRRHLKHISHHIIGDTKYGDGRHNRFFRETLKINGLLLHAEKIELNHPITNKKLVIRAPIPQPMATAVQLFKNYKQKMQ